MKSKLAEKDVYINKDVIMSIHNCKEHTAWKMIKECNNYLIKIGVMKKAARKGWTLASALSIVYGYPIESILSIEEELKSEQGS